ncbi:MAG: type IX secretion system membrane protein PorP/SprF [Fluviicola sp.]
MSKPSFTNIDLWLFEYAEGNLTDDQVAQLELFILQHPELDVDRDMWEMAHVKKEEAVYAEQDSLLKRKPVGAYWTVGAGALTMTLLIVVSYAFFGMDTSKDSDRVLTETIAYSEDFAYELLQEKATERELRQEVADLKALITSLESQIQNENRIGAAGNHNELGQIQFANNNAGNADVTDLENERLPGLASNQNVSAITNETNRNATTQGASLAATTSNDGSDMEALGTNANSSEVRSMQPMKSVRSSYLTSQRVAMHPVSREIFKASVVSNDGTETMIGSNDNQGRVVNYEGSYKHKVSKFIRQMRNMANNPIALKNYRDAYHHVPGMTATDLNFGATGTMIAPRLQVMSRLQGFNSENELLTNQVGMDGYVYGVRGGLGIQMTHNYYNNGGIQSGEVAITYSPKFSVNRKLSIEPAFRFKMGNKVLDASNMEGTEQVEFIPGNSIDYYQDGTTPVGRMLWYRDMGLGLNVNTEWFYASAQMDNLFRHKDHIYSNDLSSTRRAGTYFVATVGTDWESDDSQWETKRSKFSLSPYLVYRNFENINELWAGANFRAYWLTIGASISSNGDPAASLGVVSSDKRFSLMYNADYSRSFVTNERSLSHQLSLRIVGKQSRIGRRN